MWIFDSKGKRTEATEEDARGMISGGFSALWPRGTPEEEAFEFEMLYQDTTHADAVVRAQQPRRTKVVEQVYHPFSSFVRKEDE